MIILGVDPGLATLGYGIIETDGHAHAMRDYGTITTPAKQPMPMRLLRLFEGVDEILSRWHPDEIAFEELFFSKNVTTGIAVGQARGAALVAAARRCDDLYEYTPMQVKQAVAGYGKADKQQVQGMVRMLLHLPEIPRPDDAADALAVALCHAHSYAMRHLFRIQ